MFYIARYTTPGFQRPFVSDHAALRCTEHLTVYNYTPCIHRRNENPVLGRGCYCIIYAASPGLSGPSTGRRPVPGTTSLHARRPRRAQVTQAFQLARTFGTSRFSGTEGVWNIWRLQNEKIRIKFKHNVSVVQTSVGDPDPFHFGLPDPYVANIGQKLWTIHKKKSTKITKLI